VAENSGHEITWLKHLKEELALEGIGECSNAHHDHEHELSVSKAADSLNTDLIDRLLIARLELNPQEMTCVTSHA
jgi:ubiquitin conjugation factor E4 B